MGLVDWLIALSGFVVAAFVAITGLAGFLLIRAFIRWLCGNDDDTLSKTAPRVRTRIQHPPIETEIADVIAREYPNRKPAQFI